MTVRNEDIQRGEGHGYRHNKIICMIKCFECGKENWAMAVATGQCAWCGYNPNVISIRSKKNETDSD